MVYILAFLINYSNVLATFTFTSLLLYVGGINGPGA